MWSAGTACSRSSELPAGTGVSHEQRTPAAGPREDLIAAAATALLFMALYSLFRAFFEASREWAPDFV
jgi:hypothetical protein